MQEITHQFLHLIIYESIYTISYYKPIPKLYRIESSKSKFTSILQEMLKRKNGYSKIHSTTASLAER